MLTPRRATALVCLFLLLLIAAPGFAAAFDHYAWTDANLALIYPAAWNLPETSADDTRQSLTLGGGDTTITLTVLPVTTRDADLRPALEAQIAALHLLPLNYTNPQLYGRSGLRIDSVSANRAQVGIARSGRLPDDRALLIAGRAPASDQAAFEDDFNAVLDSIVFSADLPPIQPTYHPIWSLPSGVDKIDGLAVGSDRLYVLADDGVRVLNPQTGAAITRYDFDHPALPTGIALDAAGNVYVGDMLCRCIRELGSDGRWLDPLGSFGANAPFSLAAAPDGTLYATDVGYQLRILGASRSRSVDLNFNGSAPPLVARDGAGQVWVIEWLASLIDGSVSGAVSLIGDPAGKPDSQLQFWLEQVAPENVTAFAADFGRRSGAGDPRSRRAGGRFQRADRRPVCAGCAARSACLWRGRHALHRARGRHAGGAQHARRAGSLRRAGAGDGRPSAGDALRERPRSNVEAGRHRRGAGHHFGGGSVAHGRVWS